jgi:hypothetical protein
MPYSWVGPCNNLHTLYEADKACQVQTLKLITKIRKLWTKKALQHWAHVTILFSPANNIEAN